MKGLKESGQAVGAQAITRLADAAAPTVLDQAARLQSRQRFFNLTVTNVPGPQVPLYLLGRRLEAFYPKVPLVLNTALGIAIMSYDGHVFFGLLGDYDALADIDALADRPRRRDPRAGRGGRREARAPQAATADAGARVKRLLLLVAVVLVAAAAFVGLISVFASRDSSQVGGPSGPGVLEPDRGAEQLGADAPATPASPPADPPTSGPHKAEAVTRENAELSDDQILDGAGARQRRDRL